MTLESFLAILVLGVCGAYILNALILERRFGHEGPFKDEGKFVVFPQEEFTVGQSLTIEPEHRQGVALWDHIRRVFGVYHIEDNLWYVQKEAAERWTCSFCLSFWTTIPLTLFYCWATGLWFWFPVAHFAIAVVSRLIKKWAFE